MFLQYTRISVFFEHSLAYQDIKKATGYPIACKLGHKDSNLEMTESESVALPFGDGPLTTNGIIQQALSFFKHFFNKKCSLQNAVLKIQISLSYLKPMEFT